MKTLLLSTLIVTLASGPLLAQTTDPTPVPPATEAPVPPATETPAPDAGTPPAEPMQEGAAVGDAVPTDPKAGWMPVDVASLPIEELQGVVVYDAQNANVGEISTIVTGDDGRATTAVVDVGGFLGFGEKPVALPMEDLEILRAENGFDLRAYVSLTREQLEAMPDYEG